MRRGSWIGPDQLVLEIDTIAGVNHFTVTLNFEGDRLKVSVLSTELDAEAFARAARDLSR